jgi:DNA adenine methylase
LSTSRPSSDNIRRNRRDPVLSGLEAGAPPFLKWPGGKRWLAPLLAEIVRPDLKGTYFEPFLGGGAVFLQLNPERAVLSDVNPDLISFLETIRQCPRQVVNAVWRYTNTKECYYKVRKMRPRTSVGAAARFLYLNRTCWGGIYRLNREGEFNTPFGYSGRTICRLHEVLEGCVRFDRAELVCRDFEVSLPVCRKGDVVYLDPPLRGSRCRRILHKVQQAAFHVGGSHPARILCLHGRTTRGFDCR